MRASSKKESLRSGAILPIVVMTLMIFSLAASGLFSLSRKNAVLTARELSRTQAFWMAEAGLHELRAVLFELTNHKALENLGLVHPDDPVTSGSIEGGGSYAVRIVPTTHRMYRATITGIAPGGTLHDIEQDIRLTSFSEHVYATNDERNHEFFKEEILVGSIRSNTEFTVTGVTNFSSMVCSGGQGYHYTEQEGFLHVYHKKNNGIFTGGLELNAPELDFYPRVVRNIRDNSIRVISNGGYFQITLLGDKMHIAKHYKSKIQWTNTVSIAAPYPDFTGVGANKTYTSGDYDKDTHNTMFFGDNVYIRGKVKGHITIIGQFNIFVDDDITYDSAPDPNFENWPAGFEPTDSLGLFAHRSVTIDIPDDQKVGRDVNIHAAILTEEDTIDSGFRSADWNQNLGDASINLYGSVAQDYPGDVNDGSGNGYKVNYHYDPRFRLYPPQGAPYGPPELRNWDSTYR